MGHKEDLLDGAKRMLLERGYANTTARDIVAASKTNLASIGYHFGSKEQLSRNGSPLPLKWSARAHNPIPFISSGGAHCC